MAVPIITLYDVPNHSPQPWVPNSWRVRFILNHKRLMYRTQWVQFPDVETTLRGIGALPSSWRSDGRPVYALPAIVDPTLDPSSPKVLSNLNQIVEYLEATYPARPVFPEGSRALQGLFVWHIQEIFVKPLLPIMIPLSHQNLPEHSQIYFRNNPSQSPFGPVPTTTMILPEQRERAWSIAKEQFDLLATMLDKNRGDGDGVVAMGTEVSYADFALCAVLIWIERVDTRDGWTRVRSWNGGRWARLYDRCRPLMEVY
ncbi:hypothetical protein BDN72DRAFT_844970 [Pluteus cervinus]|uniref:Uncharacterized protein n=1 Tax=Pluteus cervinus TaxID=181527 RepID=A0ACD3AK10_9AGAR|nr:hypothetical protein BDN72DRAFT_844970 [Pluteus cervinus]